MTWREIRVRCNHQAEPRIGRPEAIIILLPIAVREAILVEQSNPVHDLADQTEAKAVNKNIGPHRPQHEMQFQAEDPSIIYRVADALLRRLSVVHGRAPSKVLIRHHHF